MGSPDIDARMAALTWPQWDALFAWLDKEPALVVVDGRALINREIRAIVARLREKLDGLSEPQLRLLGEFSRGCGFGGHGRAVVLRNLEAKGFAEPEHGWAAHNCTGDYVGPLTVRVLPQGRAALRLEADRG